MVQPQGQAWKGSRWWNKRRDWTGWWAGEPFLPPASGLGCSLLIWASEDPSALLAGVINLLLLLHVCVCERERERERSWWPFTVVWITA